MCCYSHSQKIPRWPERPSLPFLESTGYFPYALKTHGSPELSMLTTIFRLFSTLFSIAGPTPPEPNRPPVSSADWSPNSNPSYSARRNRTPRSHHRRFNLLPAVPAFPHLHKTPPPCSDAKPLCSNAVWFLSLERTSPSWNKNSIGDSVTPPHGNGNIVSCPQPRRSDESGKQRTRSSLRNKAVMRS